jgi:hypothetical protein
MYNFRSGMFWKRRILVATVRTSWRYHALGLYKYLHRRKTILLFVFFGLPSVSWRAVKKHGCNRAGHRIVELLLTLLLTNVFSVCFAVPPCQSSNASASCVNRWKHRVVYVQEHGGMHRFAVVVCVCGPSLYVGV